MAHLLDLTTQGDVGTLADPAKLAGVTLITRSRTASNMR